jgi:hypothetical protein
MTPMDGPMDGHRNAISDPKLKLLLLLEMQCQQAKDVDQTDKLAAVAETFR